MSFLVWSFITANIEGQKHVSSSGHNSIGVQFIEQAWEQLRSITVDREGEYTFLLRPRGENISHRLLCEVQVQDNVKLVTLRSTYKVQNQTLYPIEVTLVDDKGRPVYSLEKIGKLKLQISAFRHSTFLAPGQDYALPIQAVATNRIRIQPDRTFYIPIPNDGMLNFAFRGLRLSLVFSDTMGGSHFQEKLHRQMPSHR